MRLLRRTPLPAALRERLSRDPGVELSAEDQFFAERLSEMFRAYVEAEIPDPVVPEFRIPDQSRRRAAARRGRKAVRPVRRSLVRRSAVRSPLEVSHEDPH
jgi:hypothetical protein